MTEFQGWANGYISDTCRVEEAATAPKVLGVHVGNADQAVSDFRAAVLKVEAARASIMELDHPQCELTLQRRCLDVSQCSYILRCIGDRIPECELHRFDDSLRVGVETSLAGRLPDVGWIQATLAVDAGGIGMRESAVIALPAFIASRVSSRPLVNEMFQHVENAGIGSRVSLLHRYDQRTRAALRRWLDSLPQGARDQVHDAVERAAESAERRWRDWCSGEEGDGEANEGAEGPARQRGSRRPAAGLVPDAGTEDPEHPASPAPKGGPRLQSELVRFADATVAHGLLAKMREAGDWEREQLPSELSHPDGSHEWLWAVGPNKGKTLSKDDFVTAVRLRLGAAGPDDFAPCGNCGDGVIGPVGTHGLLCACGPSARGHNAVRDELYDIASSLDSTTGNAVRFYARMNLVGREVCMYAQMLHQILYVHNYTLESVQKRTEEAYGMIQELFGATDFQGVTGRIALSPHKVEPDGAILLQHLRRSPNGVEVVDIAVYESRVQLAAGLLGNNQALTFLGLANLTFSLPGENYFAGPDGAHHIDVTPAARRHEHPGEWSEKSGAAGVLHAMSRFLEITGTSDEGLGRLTRLWLKSFMEQFGEVLSLHKPPTSGDPKNDVATVRFAREYASEQAVAALKSGAELNGVPIRVDFQAPKSAKAGRPTSGCLDYDAPVVDSRSFLEGRRQHGSAAAKKGRKASRSDSERGKRSRSGKRSRRDQKESRSSSGEKRSHSARRKRSRFPKEKRDKGSKGKGSRSSSGDSSPDRAAKRSGGESSDRESDKSSRERVCTRSPAAPAAPAEPSEAAALVVPEAPAPEPVDAGTAAELAELAELRAQAERDSRELEELRRQIESHDAKIQMLTAQLA
ncbi:unnamed protein product [Prorocentrum cordatum]|uniref:RRM domain-containing protein n=1 Tax=Prorocentrum cordatum TaxID=2364126 RepID=A0ABN9V1E2_9DINO|nr:unnamed protein product [Polarella glacialis]